LGLGLVLPQLRKFGGTCVLAARENAKKRRFLGALEHDLSYELVTTNTGRSERVDFRQFVYLGAPELTELIADPETSILTTSVGPSSFPDVSSHIAAGLRLRLRKGEDSPLYVIACENPPGDSQSLREHIAQRLDPDEIRELDGRILFPNAIVDRLCKFPIEGDTPHPSVQVEEKAEWVLHFPAHQPLVPFDAAGIAVVEDCDRFEVLKRRKAVIINGTHLVIAVYAYMTNQEALGDVLHDASLQRKVSAIQAGLIGALLRPDPRNHRRPMCPEADLDQLVQYAREFCERVHRGPRDDKERILRNLMEVVEKAQGRVLDTCGEDFEKRTWQENLEKTLELLRFLDFHPFFEKTYSRMYKPMEQLVDLSQSGAHPAELPIILAEWFVYAYHIVEKELGAYSASLRQYVPQRLAEIREAPAAGHAAASKAAS
jgi:hypothetical protein